VTPRDGEMYGMLIPTLSSRQCKIGWLDKRPAYHRKPISNDADHLLYRICKPLYAYVRVNRSCPWAHAIQVLFEVPCNIILKRTTPKLWLPTLMFLWGTVATLMGVSQNFAGFLAARFFLGVTESGLFPGVVFYLSMWYKRTETHYRVALFFSAASLAGAFGGILAYGIGFMVGVAGLKGWRWIFILVSSSTRQCRENS
jgi:hypothetical protein